MVADISHVDRIEDADWAELEELLAEMARLTKSDAPLDRVAHELVEQLVQALEAVGAAFWLCDQQGTLVLTCQRNLEALGDYADSPEHHELMRAALDARHPTAVPANQQHAEEHSRRHTLLLAPLAVDAKAVGLIEVVQRPDISSDAQEGNLRFAALLAELAADHLRRSEVRTLRGAALRTQQFAQFAANIHKTLDPRRATAALVNEGRTLIGCDRVSAAVRRGRRFRLTAVSSVDRINRRAASVRLLEKLIERVTAAGDEFWYDGDQGAVPPQIEENLTGYLDASHAQQLGIIALRGSGEATSDGEGPVIGALVVEAFDAQPWDSDRGIINAVAGQGESALDNALRYCSLPTLPFLRNRSYAASAPHRRILKTSCLLIGIALLASTFLIKSNFYVYAEGELHPQASRHIYAPLDGHVAAVMATHGQSVAPGQTLVEMASPELDLQIQKIQGEHDATLQRSIAIEAALLDYRPSLDPDGVQMNKLAAEQEELFELFESQKERLNGLRQQRENLTVRSPINGTVLTWETDEQLLNRPVRRGQTMMTVANLDGVWEAKLHVPDDQVGPLLETGSDGVEPLTATFELATERGVQHEGRVTRLARRTEINADGRPIVRVVVEVANSALADPRPGATVHARILCGRESLAYVWCHQVWDRVRGWLFF